MSCCGLAGLYSPLNKLNSSAKKLSGILSFLALGLKSQKDEYDPSDI